MPYRAPQGQVEVPSGLVGPAPRWRARLLAREGAPDPPAWAGPRRSRHGGPFVHRFELAAQEER
jgi:hypothetical protein